MATMDSDVVRSPEVPAAPPRRRTQRRRTIADILTQYLLPLVAMAMLGFALWYVAKTKPVTRNPPPPIMPARSPYAATLAAAVIVEAQTENISVGSATPGVVVQVLVKVGDAVKAGQPLFRLDDRHLQGELAVKRAMVSQAKNELIRLEAEPRKEKIPVIVTQVNEARAAVIRETDALKRTEDTFARKVTTEQDLIERREAFAGAPPSSRSLGASRTTSPTSTETWLPGCASTSQGGGHKPYGSGVSGWGSTGASMRQAPSGHCIFWLASNAVDRLAAEAEPSDAADSRQNPAVWIVSWSRTADRSR